MAQSLVKQGLLRPYQSPCKHSYSACKGVKWDTHQLLQDLWARNEATKESHPVVPNVHITLCPDLWDVGFSVRHKRHLLLCAPNPRISRHLCIWMAWTWTTWEDKSCAGWSCPRALKPPYPFRKIWAEDLGDLELEQTAILQQVHDILIASPTKKLSLMIWLVS